ncbi:hypothetical protein FNF28_04714 [Cafeteria roenbergensis]|uniref:SprT-like domain-containing protein n=1 Tax=Cafeteria roenbergensis TaxID=33653 RepID=A0A5A8DCW0_CAFRO|nr:hypothetical protein FNF28_04714 [Cafeteria roenbergensis]
MAGTACSDAIAIAWASGPATFDERARRIKFREKHPNLHELFTQFNHLFFGGALDCVSVEWSKRMTLCAGQCQFSRTHCVVKLSEPLLALRPEADLVDTLLHEQIHAWLWTRRVFEREDNGHGPQFKAKMQELNQAYGTSISPYHDWHAEVDSFRGHWWRCTGMCRHQPPRYGMVKRAMNRRPGPLDPWWKDHAERCGGSYVKGLRDGEMIVLDGRAEDDDELAVIDLMDMSDGESLCSDQDALAEWDDDGRVDRPLLRRCLPS